MSTHNYNYNNYNNNNYYYYYYYYYYYKNYYYYTPSFHFRLPCLNTLQLLLLHLQLKQLQQLHAN